MHACVSTCELLYLCSYLLIYVSNCVYFGAWFVLPEVGWGFDPTSLSFVTCPKNLQSRPSSATGNLLFLFFFSPFLLLYVLMLIWHTLWLLPASRKHQKKHYSNCSDSYCTSFTAIDLKATRKLLYCWSFFRFSECLFFAAKSLFFSLWIY